jgi:hypothetical protein
MASEESDFWKDYKEKQKQAKSDKREVAIDEINSLRQLTRFKVEQITKYHFRVNGKWDLYPTTRRIFMVGRTDRFYGWKNSADLLHKIEKLDDAGTMPVKIFDLKYFVGGKERETLASGAWSVCEKKKRECIGSGQYKAGILRVVEKS